MKPLALSTQNRTDNNDRRPERKKHEKKNSVKVIVSDLMLNKRFGGPMSISGPKYFKVFESYGACPWQRRDSLAIAYLPTVHHAWGRVRQINAEL